MPENWSIHHEQEQLALFSKECARRDVILESEGEDEENIQDIGELLGFRVTGGSDFFMPITIFHVKENSRAEKANLKLGDAIISINGKDTSQMTLLRANRFLAKVAVGDVILQVTKFNCIDEDDDDVQTIEEVILEGPKSLEQKLRTMQKQLLEMTDIPVQIQSKISMVTKALESFISMDSDALESSWREESQELSSEKQFSSIPEENEEDDDVAGDGNNNEENSQSSDHLTRETSFSLDDDDLEEQYKEIEENDEMTDADNCDTDVDEKSTCESVKSEEMLKLEEEKKKKNEKNSQVGKIMAKTLLKHKNNSQTIKLSFSSKRRVDQ